MSAAWLKKSGFMAMGLLAMGAIVSGCSSDAALPPLSLYVDEEINALNEEVLVTLDNPSESLLFIPTAWTGIAMYRLVDLENWVEYRYPDAFQTMQSTSAEKILWSIPAGILEPGSYKLVLQGRTGRDGSSFSLEANLQITSLIMTGNGKTPGF